MKNKAQQQWWREAIFKELKRESSLKGISIKLSRDTGKFTQEVEVPEEYQRHTNIFDPVELKKLPPSWPWDHAITLKPDAPDTIDCKLYPLPPKDNEALRKWLKEEEDKGYIRPSISPIASSFFFLQKADSSQRPVQDYRGVNKWTVCNRYPLPLIPELIAEVQDAFIFTKFDIEGGFNKVRIKDRDQHKAAFKTKYGLYELMVMYFGLCNSLATFQNMMNHIFWPLKDKWAKKGVKIIVYMDDILIATSTSLQDHRDATHDVLDLLQEHNLFLKKKKCRWEVDSIDYLGLILEKGVTHMDPTKVEGIKNWPRPAKVKDICSFLGFCNFYWPFIPSFSKIAKPLNELTRKDVPFVWEDIHEIVFNTLRDLVTSEPVLWQPQLDKPFEVEVDASGFALGGVLLQRQEDGKKHPIGYYSATLNEAQCNYDIYELELLAIAECLKHWRPYLAGSPHEIIVHTDHANLTYWRQPQKISRRIPRQVLELEEYNIKLQHVLGKNNGRADALSRRPDYDQGTSDNQNVTVLPDSLFIWALASQDLEQDEEVLKSWIDPHKLKQIRGTWWKGNQLVVTTDIPARRAIVQAHHNPPAYGHPGISRTTELIARRYWWPWMAQDVKDYVKGCADCQRNKVNNQARKAPLSLIFAKPEALPFKTVSMDFIVKLPLSNGYVSPPLNSDTRKGSKP